MAMDCLNRSTVRLMLFDDCFHSTNCPATPQVPPVDVETLVNDICGWMDYDIDEEEDVLIHFNEHATEIKQHVLDATICAKIKEQCQQRTNTVVFHHGQFNPLPSSWSYPKKMTMIQLITLYQMGSPSDGVFLLKLVNARQVKHFDKEGRISSRMRRVMAVVRYYGLEHGTWKPRNAQNYWNRSTVTRLWNGIWNDLGP
jgi:hypothetical protein